METSVYFNDSFVNGRETYPVVGDLFLALVGYVRTGSACHAEPCRDGAVAEVSIGRLLGVVGHEAVDLERYISAKPSCE